MKLTAQSKSAAQAFAELLAKGFEAWLDAGKIAAAELDKNPDWAEEVAKLPPFPTEQVVKTFARMGRMQLHPLLACPGRIGLQRLARLPYRLQEKHLKEPVEVLVSNGETLKIDVHNLTEEQAVQVFSRDDIRDLPEQRAWMEGQRLQSAPPTRANLPYRYDKKELVVLVPCKFTRKELAQLLADME